MELKRYVGEIVCSTVFILATKLEWLILNPEKIIEISKNARAFIEREHHYVRIAERYVNTWIENS